MPSSFHSQQPPILMRIIRVDDNFTNDYVITDPYLKLDSYYMISKIQNEMELDWYNLSNYIDVMIIPAIREEQTMEVEGTTFCSNLCMNVINSNNELVAIWTRYHLVCRLETSTVRMSERKLAQL